MPNLPAIFLGVCMVLTTPAYAEDLSQWKRVISTAHFNKPAQEFHGKILPVLRKLKKKYERVPYVTDQANYGVEDYWATREEMQEKGGGDCEDFAIAEYYDLLELGVPDRDMEILIVFTTTGQQHAILAVRGYVLDNRSDSVISLKRAESFYMPIYSLNRLAWGPVNRHLT